jgi:hypothetical protein
MCVEDSGVLGSDGVGNPLLDLEQLSASGNQRDSNRAISSGSSSAEMVRKGISSSSSQ